MLEVKNTKHICMYYREGVGEEGGCSESPNKGCGDDGDAGEEWIRSEFEADVGSTRRY